MIHQNFFLQSLILRLREATMFVLLKRTSLYQNNYFLSQCHFSPDLDKYIFLLFKSFQIFEQRLNNIGTEKILLLEETFLFSRSHSLEWQPLVSVKTIPLSRTRSF